MSSHLVTVKDLRVFYRTTSDPVRAVDGVSLSVDRGEIFGIVGESGCGKSTLSMGMLNLISPPAYIEGGEISIDGVKLLDLNEEELRRLRLKHFSYIPQGSMDALNPVMKIKDQIIDGIMAHEYTKRKEAQQRVKPMLEKVGLSSETAEMYPHELSGGMRQRVTIAAATVLHPKFVVADEPSTALDVVVQRLVLQFLLNLREQGSSVILVSHDVAVQAEVCDRLGVMYAGKIVEIGGVKEMFRNSLHPYTQKLIEATPSIERRKTLARLAGVVPSLVHPSSGCRFVDRCPLADDQCKKEEPKLLEITPGHLVACLLSQR